MKKVLSIISIFLFILGTSFAQSIQFELTSTTPEFQDADVGDMEFPALSKFFVIYSLNFY